MVKNEYFHCFQMLKCCIYHAHKYKNANKCFYIYIYNHDKVHAQLSSAKKRFYNLGPWFNLGRPVPV